MSTPPMSRVITPYTSPACSPRALRPSPGSSNKPSFLLTLQDASNAPLSSRRPKKATCPYLNSSKMPALVLTATDQDGDNALHLACASFHSTEIVSWLIQQAKISIESQGLASNAHLSSDAAETGNLPLLKHLKDAGANTPRHR